MPGEVEEGSGATYDGQVTDRGDPPSEPPSTSASDGDPPAAAVPAPAHAPPHDEPGLAGQIRRIDDLVGATERVLIGLAFATLVLTGLYRTFVDFAFGQRPLWAIELLRVAAFSIGMMGAAYAAQSRRNFGLDLVSALMSTKFKAVTRVFTNLVTLIAAGLLFHGGRLIQVALAKEKPHYEVISPMTIGWFIPVCAVLIGFHVFCHMVIEIDYLRQGKTAPEPELVG